MPKRPKNKIDIILEKLDRLIALLEANQTQQQINMTDPNPWPFALLREASTAEDCDGNGRIYGHDFMFDENLENFPPIIMSHAKQFLKNEIDLDRMTWEQYYDSLPDGAHKTKMGPWMAKLGERLNPAPLGDAVITADADVGSEDEPETS